MQRIHQVPCQRHNHLFGCSVRLAISCCLPCSCGFIAGLGSCTGFLLGQDFLDAEQSRVYCTLHCIQPTLQSRVYCTLHCIQSVLHPTLHSAHLTIKSVLHPTLHSECIAPYIAFSPPFASQEGSLLLQTTPDSGPAEGLRERSHVVSTIILNNHVSSGCVQI